MEREFIDPVPADRDIALIRESVVARRWGKSVRTLQRMRQSGTGPAFIRIGSTVFYTMTDILAHECANRHGGTQP